MRKLKTDDIFKFAKCITRLELKEELANIAKEYEDGKINNSFNAGFDIIWGLVVKASEKETVQLIYDFLAGPFECTPKAVGDMDLEELIEKLKTLAEENNLRAFFKSAAASMK